jgi:hypothetical protein
MAATIIIEAMPMRKIKRVSSEGLCAYAKIPSMPKETSETTVSQNNILTRMFLKDFFSIFLVAGAGL